MCFEFQRRKLPDLHAAGQSLKVPSLLPQVSKSAEKGKSCDYVVADGDDNDDAYMCGVRVDKDDTRVDNDGDDDENDEDGAYV